MMMMCDATSWPRTTERQGETVTAQTTGYVFFFTLLMSTYNRLVRVRRGTGLIDNATATTSTSNSDNNNVCLSRHIMTKVDAMAGGQWPKRRRQGMFLLLHFITLLMSTYNRLRVRRGTGLIEDTISNSDDNDMCCHIMTKDDRTAGGDGDSLESTVPFFCSQMQDVTSNL